MICYQDRCFCIAEHCIKYKTCKDTYRWAKKDQQRNPDVTKRMLPFDVCDMSKRCKEYEVGE